MPGFVSRIPTFGSVVVGARPGPLANLSAGPVFSRITGPISTRPEGRHRISVGQPGTNRNQPRQAGRNQHKTARFLTRKSGIWESENEAKKARKETEKCIAVQHGIVCGTDGGSGRSGFPEHAWHCASQELQAPTTGAVGPTPSLVLLYLTEAATASTEVLMASSGRLTQR